MATSIAAAGGSAPGTPKKALISQRQRAFRSFMRNKAAVVGAVMIVFLVIMAVFAPWIAPYDPLVQSTINKFQGPSSAHWLGTDDYGRDVLSRIIWGTRVALQVGIFSVIIGAVIGITLGVTAGYFGGVIDNVLMRIVDIMLSFPDLITGLLVMAVLGAGKTKLIIAIGLTVAPRFARIAYGPVLGLKETEYIEAARAIGQSTPKIINRHILPNIAGEMIVLGSLWTASAIRLEASLSFIGLGVPPPTPTWGQMIRDGAVRLSDLPLLSLAPGAALLIAVFAFNLVGDGLRDVLDPRAN
ncbi:MAG: ABC transporter permease [Thermomicrobiales bacterium]|nr:ABC transporter permease [Thermomicrobiales bacterium]MCO5219807.1 ABC transporter permease [Thermomicrobiales bacterium]MCO5224756.1 ABC transporter permease [Thermomicrobiales bacterium]MCO5228416.1 ABC transporter permease [Thermomicrobiales bacterium]